MFRWIRRRRDVLLDGVQEEERSEDTTVKQGCNANVTLKLYTPDSIALDSGRDMGQ